MAKVWIPERILASRSKSVIGPYARVRGHYYVILSLAGPPLSRRWEIHIIIDRAGLLQEKDGVRFAAGPVTLLKHDNMVSLARNVARDHKLRIYVPPWATPAILAIDSRRPSPEEVEELRLAGLDRAQLAVGELAAQVEIFEK